VGGIQNRLARPGGGLDKLLANPVLRADAPFLELLPAMHRCAMRTFFGSPSSISDIHCLRATSIKGDLCSLSDPSHLVTDDDTLVHFKRARLQCAVLHLSTASRSSR
jgi:hypothetical protein